MLDNKTDIKPILLVDDEKDFTETTGMVLQAEGYRVQLANSGEEAIKLYEKGKYSLIITDINMPGLDGIELIRRIHEIDSEQRVIVLTGFPSHESQDEAFRLGSVNYLAKPFLAKRFIEVIEASLRNDDNSNELTGPIKVTCEDLLQMYAMEGKSTVLEISKGKNTGRIYFDKGAILHAETNANQGEEAFYEMQFWKGGRFDSKPLPENFPVTIQSSMTALLLEGARRHDERLQQEGGVEIENENIEEFTEEADKEELSIKENKMPELDTLLQKIETGVANIIGIVGVTEDGAVAANHGVDTPDEIGAVAAFVNASGKQLSAILGLGTLQAGVVTFGEQKLLAVNHNEYTIGLIVDGKASIKSTIAVVKNILST